MSTGDEEEALMSKETAKQQPNPSGDSQIKDKAGITVLTDEEVNEVSGGKKHLAGVKYEDITINCTTTTTSRP